MRSTAARLARMSPEVGEEFKAAVAIGALVTAAAALVSVSGFARGLAPAGRRTVRAVVLIGAVGLIVLDFSAHISNVRTPRPWDYPPLYIAAKAAARGDSMYAPDSLRAVHGELVAEVDLSRVYIETVKTPFNPYLPVTALMTAPLGALDYRLSLAVHCILMSICFALGVVALREMSLRLGDPLPTPALAALLLAYPAVLSAFASAQNVFGAFLFVSLWMTLADRKPIAAGVAIAAAFPFKHLALIPATFSAAISGGRVVVGATVSLAVLAVFSVWVFGVQSYGDYIRWGTAVPYHHYVEPVSQSLLAVVLRISSLEPLIKHGPSYALHPPFLFAAGLLVAATLWVVVRASRDEQTGALKRALVLVTALVVYPGTLFNTLVLMLPVFAVVLSLRNALGWPEWLTLAFVLLQYALLSPRADGTWWFHGGFPAMTLAWCFLFVTLVRKPAFGPSS